MPVGNILTMDDLLKIQALLSEEGYGECRLKITIPVRNTQTLARVNEEFYYKNNKEGTPPDVEVVDVNVGNINFEYIVEENAES